MGAGSQGRLRSSNQASVIDALRLNGPLTRAGLVEATGLSRTTVSTLLGDLIERGLVCDGDDSEEAADVPRGSGRPSRRVRLDASAGAAVSVDIGARHLAVAIGDLGHRVLARRWIPLEHGHDVESRIDAAGALVDE